MAGYRPMRYALVRGLDVTRERVAAYLPSNYKAVWHGTTDWHWMAQTQVWKQIPGLEDEVVLIEGRDAESGGFSLDKYVAPRLGSGLMRCDEVDLSHPIMKTIDASLR